MAQDILGAADILGYDDLLGAEIVLGDDDLLGYYEDLLGATPAQLRAMQMAESQGRPTARTQNAAALQRAVQTQKGKAAAAAMLATRQQNTGTAIQQVLANRGAVLQDREPSRSRHWMLNFDSGAAVAAGANIQLISRPQVIFRPERLVIGGAFAASFAVNDIKVGKNSQIVNAASGPGDAFAPTAFGVELRLDTCQVSQDIVLDVTNISGAPLRFMASMFGTGVE
jgi:hypothetical protein